MGPAPPPPEVPWEVAAACTQAWDPATGTQDSAPEDWTPESWAATAVFDLGALAPDVVAPPPLRRSVTPDSSHATEWWTSLCTSVHREVGHEAWRSSRPWIGWAALDRRLFVRGSADVLCAVERVLDRVATDAAPVSLRLERGSGSAPRLVLGVPTGGTGRAFEGVRALYVYDYEVVINMAIECEGPVLDFAEWGTAVTARRRTDATDRRWIDVSVEQAPGPPSFRRFETSHPPSGLDSVFLEEARLDPARWTASVPEASGSYDVADGEWTVHVDVGRGTGARAWRRGYASPAVQGVLRATLTRNSTGETLPAASTVDVGEGSFAFGSSAEIPCRSRLGPSTDDSREDGIGARASLAPCRPGARELDVVFEAWRLESERSSLVCVLDGCGGREERTVSLPVWRAFTATRRVDLASGCAFVTFVGDVGDGPESWTLSLAGSDAD